MKQIKYYWERKEGDAITYMLRNMPTKESKRAGYIYGKCVIDATFQAECEDDDFFGADRTTLQAAINDAKRHFKKTGNECCIYAHWTETDLSLDGKWQYGEPDEDCGLVGFVATELFDMGNIDWLN